MTQYSAPVWQTDGQTLHHRIYRAMNMRRALKIAENWIASGSVNNSYCRVCSQWIVKLLYDESVYSG